MIFIYEAEEIDLIVEPTTLNGNDGAISITDSQDDLDITFEDIETAREWATVLIEKLAKVES